MYERETKRETAFIMCARGYPAAACDLYLPHAEARRPCARSPAPLFCRMRCVVTENVNIVKKVTTFLQFSLYVHRGVVHLCVFYRNNF